MPLLLQQPVGLIARYLFVCGGVCCVLHFDQARIKEGACSEEFTAQGT